MEIVFGLLVLLGIPFAVLYWLYGRSLWDSTVCPDCHVAMRATGYVAFDFKRHYVCPLCNWSTYVADPLLKAEKLARLKKSSTRSGEQEGDS